MKTNSRILRGYNNNHSIDRSNERDTAPSAINKAKKKKNEVDYFSKPSLYALPPVHGAKQRKDDI